MKVYVIFFSLIVSTFAITAQTDSIYSFSINEAIEFAMDNNINVKNSEFEIRKAKWKVWETTAIGLPHVSGSIEYQNFPDIPTQLMPNFITPAVVGTNMQYFGLTPVQPIPEDNGTMPVQFGSQHNANWGLSVSQLIFSG